MADADKRLILVNPDEPRAGDYAYSLYDKAHPYTGDPETIAHFKKELAGLRGERVRLVFNGMRKDADGNEHRFRLTRTFNFRNYKDVFGPGSAYARALHAQRDKHSDDQFVTFSVALEVLEIDNEPEDEDEDA